MEIRRVMFTVYNTGVSE